MPTARELLEQADALMRRNRTSEFEPDIPELTDEVALAAPLLPVRQSSPASRLSQQVRRGRRDGVPELDDAVVKVDALSIESLSGHGGEDSRWLEVGLGEASVTGPAPDSIVVVPASPLRLSPSEERDHAPRTSLAQGSATPPPTSATTLAPKIAGTLSGVPAESPPLNDPGFDAMLGAAPADVAVVPAPLSVAPMSTPDEVIALEPIADREFEEELAPEPAMPLHEEAQAPEPFADREFEEELAPEPAMPLHEEAQAPEPLADREFEEELAPEPAMPLREEVQTPEPSAPPEAVDAAAPQFPHAQQWEGLAEEIRMQVLQRIDIFTDTGLHGELAARLQPIVDRASADLVTTINREVGQILRTYVAEAIEREIEKWRAANP